ncbi:MAG TPA: hypothetical protein VFT91_06165 [Dehalococcoidia bacterium]|nr:hypothetical protein [Dehalococcoidia bacterium]
MNNETNRSIIVLLAALWIVLMAVVIFIAWAAPDDAVDRLGDMVEYLNAHRDDPSRLILTLGALLLVVLALLLIIVEMAPEETERELKVEQGGATTIVPAEALRLRLEEALRGLPQVAEARARVFSRDKGIGSSLDLTITADANVAMVTQEATRVVVDTLQTDLGLPAAGLPTVRVVFGQARAEPVASSVVQAPLPGPAAFEEAPPPVEEAPPATAEAPPAATDEAVAAEEAPAEPQVQEEPPGEQPQP